jgi:hypothetical protein
MSRAARCQIAVSQRANTTAHERLGALQSATCMKPSGKIPAAEQSLFPAAEAMQFRTEIYVCVIQHCRSEYEVSGGHSNENAVL